MKKILVTLFSFIFIFSVTSAIACSTCGCQNKTEIKKEVKSCDKNQKSCCSSKSSKSSCDKSSKSCCSSKKNNKGNNYSKKNKYNNKKTSCNKSQKSCCSKKTTNDLTSKKDNSVEDKSSE
tara:strand:+ start:307 stop:669 length:363 start_codon:yes stop_codon:yes gene_type:complete